MAIKLEVVAYYWWLHSWEQLKILCWRCICLVSRYQKGKTSLDLLEQEIVSGSGISWAICKSAPCPQTHNASIPPLSFFTSQMPFLPLNQQRQSTEGMAILQSSALPSAVPHWSLLAQPSQFILVWDRHEICRLAYPVAWLHTRCIRQLMTRKPS